MPLRMNVIYLLRVRPADWPSRVGRPSGPMCISRMDRRIRNMHFPYVGVLLGGEREHWCGRYGAARRAVAEKGGARGGGG